MNYAFDIFFADLGKSLATGAELVFAEESLPNWNELVSYTITGNGDVSGILYKCVYNAGHLVLPAVADDREALLLGDIAVRRRTDAAGSFRQTSKHGSSLVPGGNSSSYCVFQVLGVRTDGTMCVLFCPSAETRDGQLILGQTVQ